MKTSWVMSMMMTTVTVDVSVRQLFGIGHTYIQDLDVENEGASRHRVVEIHVDHAAAYLGDNPIAKPGFGANRDHLAYLRFSFTDNVFL